MTAAPPAAPASDANVVIAGTTETDNANMPAKPKCRLMIQKMVLENFKSYAGAKEIGPFHKCFSSVVGPNGSGKSNVIDAMLFVFGKRAKKLRLNKVSELIHSSDAFKDNPLSYARVSVHFHDIVDHLDGDENTEHNNANADTSDGVNDYTVIPNSEIIVTRTARRDNSSQYQLNGKNVPFKKVAEFLSTKGIDLNNNRFLILQGEVEMISMMPPRGKSEDGEDDGLLEYLEDIIGSHKFVGETNEAAQKVEALSEQRLEKLNRLKAVEKEKDNLEGAKLEAEALLLKERDIRRKQNILYQLQLLQVADSHNAAQTERDSLKEQLKQVRAALLEHDTKLKEGSKEVKAKQTIHDKSMETLKVAKDEFSKFERLDIQLREQVKHSKGNVTKLDKKVKSEAAKITTLEKKATLAEEQIPTLKETQTSLAEEKEGADAKLEELEKKMRGQTEELRQKLEVKLQELSPLTEERLQKQSALDTAATEAKLLQDSAERARKQLESAEATLGTLDDKQSKLRSELASSEDSIMESKSRLEEAIGEEKACHQKEGQLAKSYQDLVTQVEYTKSQLEEARQMASGSSADGTCRNRAVAAILKETKRPNSELSKAGIVGRLGDLCSIPEAYDVAISTACGMLDHVVCQTTKGAQACLTFLRANNLGRANFIPLDKMKRGAHDRPVATPEDGIAKRLFDFIEVRNPVLLPALYLAIGNTLVAPDLETATRWAYDYAKRWRVVTLDGKVIDTAGTMSGGGSSVQRGGMRLLKSKKGGRGAANATAQQQNNEPQLDVGKLEQEVAAGEQQSSSIMQELTSCRTQRKQLLDEIKQLKRIVKILVDTKLPKLALEIEGCDTTREELTQRLPLLKEQSVLSEEDTLLLTELKAKVEECKLVLAECAMKSSKLESEVAKLQKAVLNAGGKELKKQQDLVAKLDASIDQCLKDIRQATVAASSAQKNIVKTTKLKDASAKELDDTKTELESLKEQTKELEQKALVVMQAYETEKTSEQEMLTELVAAQEAHEALAKEKTSFMNNELELAAQVDSLTKSYKELSHQTKHWTKKLAQLEKLDAQCEAEYDLDSDHEDDSDDEKEEEEQKGKDSANAKEDDAMEVDKGEGDNVEASASASATGDNEAQEPKDSADAAEKEKEPQQPQLNEDTSSLPRLSKAALNQYGVEEIQHTIEVLENERGELAKTSNMGAIAEYRKKEADYMTKVADLDLITSERNDARKVHEELRRQRLEMFMDGFGIITLKLKEMYQMITLGGDAELELVDSLDPFSEGIVFSVRPPKKSWKNISNLSGGEKTLSSLALVFALHHYRPTPLYVMDEIDAALDFKNVSIVANYIKTRTKNAQFIIISLRNNMFELADRLVGIYKTNHCTKSITIDPAAFAKRAPTSASQATATANDENADTNGANSNNKAADKATSSIIVPMTTSSQTNAM